MLFHSGVRAVQIAEVIDEEVRPLGRAGGEDGFPGVYAGEHCHRGKSGVVPAEDVGVQPVAHDERPVGGEPFGGGAEQRSLGLSGHQGPLSGGRSNGSHQGSVPRSDAAGLRNGHVRVGGNPQGAAGDDVRSLSEVLPADLGIESLDHRHRVVLGTVDGCQPNQFHLMRQRRAPGHQDPRPRRKKSRQQLAGSLRGTDHLRVFGRRAKLAQVRRHLRGSPGGVIGHVPKSDVDSRQLAERLNGARDGVRTGIDNPVEIGQQGVEPGDQ
ncbi:hypothetical protein D9M72_402790 [compost metagenome]